ncbi:transposase [Streptomyces sp. NBC_00233]|uniref:transposase n=1 Tax=Streptomyces sp. NBC_00233 TaxID=2975686 RepID=UPI0022511C81|nr:transposase [Streptomyces sp. NBC_00233]MCX5233463.1 IS3 family transposase [Streptomyces sp. NBC_00233]
MTDSATKATSPSPLRLDNIIRRWIVGAKTRQERQAADDALLVEIREIHTEHKGTCGVRCVHAELRGVGHTVNRKRAERQMRVNLLEGRHLRRRKRTTVPDRLNDKLLHHQPAERGHSPAVLNTLYLLAHADTVASGHRGCRG